MEQEDTDLVFSEYVAFTFRDPKVIALFLFSLVFLMLYYYPVSAETPRTGHFQYEYMGEQRAVDIVFKNEERLDRVGPIGVHRREDAGRHEIEIAFDESSFFWMVGVCQHELKHLDYNIIEKQENKDFSYEEEELMTKRGIESRFGYSIMVQLTHFKPVCYSQSLQTYLANFP